MICFTRLVTVGHSCHEANLEGNLEARHASVCKLIYRVGQINWDKIHFSITGLFMGGFGSNFVRISIK